MNLLINAWSSGEHQVGTNDSTLAWPVNSLELGHNSDRPREVMPIDDAERISKFMQNLATALVNKEIHM